MSKAVSIQCVARNRKGVQCQRRAIKGATVCHYHGGKAPQVAAKAAVRAELMDWGMNDEFVDPGETLLKLVAQSARRANRLGIELERLLAEHNGDVRAAMADAPLLFRTEAEERDRCSTFAAKAIAAGIAERQVRMAERQDQLAIALLRAALDQLDLPDQREREIVANAYLAITSPSSA